MLVLATSWIVTSDGDRPLPQERQAGPKRVAVRRQRGASARNHSFLRLAKQEAWPRPFGGPEMAAAGGGVNLAPSVTKKNGAAP